MAIAKTLFDSATQEAYLNLWRSYDRLRAIEDRLFARWDLTAQQYNVLRLLESADDQGVPTLSLATKLVSRAPDITRIIDRLERRGLINRDRSSSDRRAVMVSITSSGRRLVDEISQPLQQCHQDQLGHMSDQELEVMTTLLCKARDPHEPDGSRWKVL